MVEKLIYNQKMYTIIDVISIYPNQYPIIKHNQEIGYVEKVVENSIPFYLLPPKDTSIEKNIGISFNKLKQYQLLYIFVSFLQQQPEDRQLSLSKSFQKFLQEEAKQYLAPAIITDEDIQNYDKIGKQIMNQFIEKNIPTKLEIVETEEYIKDPSYQPYTSILEKGTIRTPKITIKPVEIQSLVIESPVVKNDEEVKTTHNHKFTFQGMIQAFTLVMITVSISLGSLFYILISI